MAQFLLHVAVSVIGAAGFFAWFILRKTPHHPKASRGFIVFLLASVLFFIVDRSANFFDALGSWQSIFSSGTATLSAILYYASWIRPDWRRGILQSFLTIFKIIWVGLGLLVVSEFWVLREGIAGVQNLFYSAPFLFSQILIVVIVLNGVYIGKRLGIGLVTLLKSDPVSVPPQDLARRIAVSGSISIVSWYSLLAARGGFLGGTSLPALLLWYAGAVAVVIVSNALIEPLLRKK